MIKRLVITPIFFMTERFSSSALGFVCTLVAGSGLMALRGLDRLRGAEVVVHDRLVSAEFRKDTAPTTVRMSSNYHAD
jgi:hypothetical protein